MRWSRHSAAGERRSMNGERATTLYRLGRPLARFCFGTFGRMEVIGKENVPPRGPVILACNHLAFTDPPLLVAAIPRPLHFLGKRELFANPIGRFLMHGFQFPVRQSTASTEKCARCSACSTGTRRGPVPGGNEEQTHSCKRRSGHRLPGLKSQAPILPVGVTGTQNLRGWRMPFPLCRLTASVGPPFTLPVIEGRPPRPVMQGMLRMIMERVAMQLPPEFRGVYDPTLSPAKETQEDRGEQCKTHPSSAST